MICIYLKALTILELILGLVFDVWPEIGHRVGMGMNFLKLIKLYSLIIFQVPTKLTILLILTFL